jgi:hypothetical protein
MTLLVALWLLLWWFVYCVQSVPINSFDLKQLIETLQRVNILPRGPRTKAEFDLYVALNVTPVPECPMANRVFACNASGDVVAVNLTQTIHKPRLYNVIESLSVERVELRNFVGNVIQRMIAKEIHIYDSVLVGSTATASLDPFRFDAPILIMQNVSLPYYSPAYDSLLRDFTFCRFTNVSFRCPVPAWLRPCFPPGEPVTCNSEPMQNLNVVYGSADRDCVRSVSYPCDVVCPPLRTGAQCLNGLESGVIAVFFPAQPGFTTLEVIEPMFGEAENLFWEAMSTRGLLTRVELFDWHTLNWTVVIDRYMPPRNDLREWGTDEIVALPPIVTNMARVTFEVYFYPQDALNNIKLGLAVYPDRAKPVISNVVSCASPFSLSARSILDETIAESYCIGRICQMACINAPSFRFDRVVVPQFIAFEGGDVWRGGTLVARTSETTRVYALNSSSEPTDFINVTGIGEVTRAMLIGIPVDGQSLPGVVVPPRKGLPGVFAKFRWSVPPSGGVVVPEATGAFAGRSAMPPFALNRTTSIAVVRNATFALASGVLYRFQDGSWQNVSADLTRLKVNLIDGQPDGELELPRKLVAVNDRLLVVISALSYIHDGSVDRNRAFRWWNQTGIDVF